MDVATGRRRRISRCIAEMKTASVKEDFCRNRGRSLCSSSTSGTAGLTHTQRQENRSTAHLASKTPSTELLYEYCSIICKAYQANQTEGVHHSHTGLKWLILGLRRFRHKTPTTCPSTHTDATILQAFCMHYNKPLSSHVPQVKGLIFRPGLARTDSVAALLRPKARAWRPRQPRAYGHSSRVAAPLVAQYPSDTT